MTAPSGGTARLEFPEHFATDDKEAPTSVKIAPKFFGGVLLITFLSLSFRLRQRDFEFLIEPDFNWTLIENWRHFFEGSGALFRPQPFVYLDAQNIIYSIADLFLRLLDTSWLHQTMPSEMSYALAAATFTNILCYSIACVVFYAAIYRMTRSVAIALILAFGFFLAPQVTAISIDRIDFLNMLPLMVIFYTSCILVLNESRDRHAFALGVAIAFAATLKLNGPFLGIFPAMAAIASLRFNRSDIRLARLAMISFAVFIVTYMLLMSRYIINIPIAEFPKFYVDSIQIMNQWSGVLVGPWTYYNFDLLLGHGLPFVALYFVCAAFTVIAAIVSGNRIAVFLSLLFVTFSVAGFASLKHSRAGYHFLPVFFAMIGFVVYSINTSRSRRRVKVVALFAVGAALLSDGYHSVKAYSAVVAHRLAESDGIDKVKRQPMRWLAEHVPAGTEICVQTHSEWTLPPLDGFKVKYELLDLPYLDSRKLAKTLPPSIEEIRVSCPIVVTSDWHRRQYDANIRVASSMTADKWIAFFKDLDTQYPPKIFSSPVAAPARDVYINVLRDVN